MKTNTPTDNRTVGMAAIEQELTAFVEATTTALEETEASEETIQTVEDAGDSLKETLEEATIIVEDTADAEENQPAEDDDLRERVSELERKADLYFEDICDLEMTTRDLKEQVEELDDRSSEGKPNPQDGPENRVTPQTHLEDIARLPSRLTDDEPPNIRRALFVARDVMDYTSKVPAGRAIKWSELRKVLQAADYNSHPETIRRVMDILADFGEDTVRIVDRPDKERLVCFEEDAAKRLDQLCSEDQPEDANHSVVSQSGG